MSTKGAQLKASWGALPDRCFEPLTFGELKVTDDFIWLPEPGDNDGHGGLRGSHNLFTKSGMKVLEAAPGLPYGIPHGQAVNHLGEECHLPDSMYVLKINVL